MSATTRTSSTPLWIGLASAILWLGGIGSILALVLAGVNISQSRESGHDVSTLAKLVIAIAIVGLLIVAVGILTFSGTSQQPA